MHRGFRDYPLTLPQLRLLAALTDDEQAMGDVAAELGIRPPTLTGLVDPLCCTRTSDQESLVRVLTGLEAALRTTDASTVDDVVERRFSIN